MLPVDRVVRFFETLNPESIAQLADIYAPEAYFKDPFNEVHGLPAIEHIFRHMFVQVSAPRFVITGRVVDPGGAFLVWDFFFHFRGWQPERERHIHGVTQLRFDEQGRVTWHRDYWDAAEELYLKLPVLGSLMSVLRGSLRA